MKGCLNALEYLHSLDPPIIHRDIKSENLLLTEGGLKMADFGWSNLCPELRATYCGTLEYCPPEMVLRSGHNEKLDMWCVGVLMYEMLHGHSPFIKDRPNDPKLYRKMLEWNILEGKIEFREDLSNESIELMSALLNRSPEARPSCREALRYPFFKSDRESQALRKELAQIKHQLRTLLEHKDRVIEEL